ncbi:MAG TPA: hypothetical protein VIZ20_14895 [Streptosporangiaceae bacterium]
MGSARERGGRVRSAGRGCTVVGPSRGQIAFLFGFLIVAFAVALGRGVTGAQTTGGRVAAAVFCAVLIALLVTGWIRTRW